MTPAIRNLLVGLAVAVIAATTLPSVVGAQQQKTAPAPTVTKPIKGATGEPWPDAKTIESRRLAAQNRKLFASDDPLPFTLTADFHALDNDKDPNSTKVYPGSIQFAGPDGQPKTVKVELRPRGHSRREICSFVPLRITFAKEDVKGTVFDGVNSIKLGVHCKSDVADIIAREYLIYQIDNLLTPYSFRARQALGTYFDTHQNKVIDDKKFAMFIEDDDDVARRMGGRINETQHMVFTSVDMNTITMMTLFEYMIANTDVGLGAQHNVRVIEVPTGQKYPIAYDFDYSGLVNAPYAIPSAQLHIDTVRDRLYRGPCHPAAEWAPIFAKFEAVKDKTLALYDSLPMLKNAYRTEAKKYLGDFYKTIEQTSVKKDFTECKTVGM